MEAMYVMSKGWCERMQSIDGKQVGAGLGDLEKRRRGFRR